MQAPRGRGPSWRFLFLPALLNPHCHQRHRPCQHHRLHPNHHPPVHHFCPHHNHHQRHRHFHQHRLHCISSGHPRAISPPPFPSPLVLSPLGTLRIILELVQPHHEHRLWDVISVTLSTSLTTSSPSAPTLIPAPRHRHPRDWPHQHPATPRSPHEPHRSTVPTPSNTSTSTAPPTKDNAVTPFHYQKCHSVTRPPSS